MKRLLVILTTILLLSGCATVPNIQDPKLSISKLQQKFKDIPPFIMTGGVGARYLGIGLQTQYRVDNVTSINESSKCVHR
jgi:hypothetical protein